MRRKATLVHVNVLPGVVPLAGGYLKAHALAEPDIRKNWEIELYSADVRAPASGLIRELVARRPDVVGFSVYTWNVGLVQRLLPVLRGVLSPRTQYLLGGVEVTQCGQRYVDVAWENVSVCNGEGERTFTEYLLRMEGERPELGEVRGLSFRRDGVWMTTADRPRIADLDEIPSPWLTGAMALEGIEVALFETNRGCPFACEFCFWGGAVGQKIHRLGADRIKEEIAYISRHRVKVLWLIDANFGILPRDLEIAEHIVAMKGRHRFPNQVGFSSSKNSSERVEEVSKKFAQAGLLVSHAISLQSMDEHALTVARRDNIRTDAYLRLQRRLNEWGVPSYIELIWPLPGETLESFKEGIDSLCASGAQAFRVFPLLWLNNTGYWGKTETLGVVTLKADDPAGGSEIVVQTREVGYEEYTKGLMFSTGLYLLHDCRGLRMTMRLLHTLGRARFRDVIDEFVAWMGGAAGGGTVALWRDGETHFEQMLKFAWRGAIAYAAVHRHRAEVDRLLKSFVIERLEAGRGGEGDVTDLLQAAMEFDLLSRPYVYVQTPLEVGVELERLQIRRRGRGQWVVESPFDFPAMAEAWRIRGEIGARDWRRGRFEVTIDHRPGQVFHPPAKSDEDMYWQCGRLIEAVRETEARYRTRGLDGVMGAGADEIIDPGSVGSV